MHNPALRNLKPVVLVSVLTTGLICSVAFPQQSQNPFESVTDALKKAASAIKQAAPGKQQAAPQPDQPAGSSQQGPVLSQAAQGQAAPNAAGTNASAPWTPPSNTASAPAGPLDPSKLPDISGIRIGMPREEVPGILKNMGATVNPMGREPIPGISSVLRNGARTADQMEVLYTHAPSKQIVYSIDRTLGYPQPIAHQNMVDALRKKYGKEILATANFNANNSDIPENDSQITGMWWLFDEQGHRVPPGKVIAQTPYGCKLGGTNYQTALSDYLFNRTQPATFCDTVIVLLVNFGSTEIVQGSHSYLFDPALLRRAVKATGDWQRAEAEKQHKDAVNKSKQAEPSL